MSIARENRVLDTCNTCCCEPGCVAAFVHTVLVAVYLLLGGCAAQWQLCFGLRLGACALESVRARTSVFVACVAAFCFLSVGFCEHKAVR